MSRSDHSAPCASAPAKSRRVLYVDDNPFLRLSVCALLARHGYAVDTANDGLEAWEKVRSEPVGFEIVITDRDMPRMDGMELVRRLREASFQGWLIVFAGELPPTCVAEFRTLEVDAIVEKGTAPAALIAAVARVASSGR